MAEHDDRTVLILGAGASKASDFKLPTMTGFFDSRLGDFPELDKFLKWFYGKRDRSEYNLEEILVYLELSRNRVPLWEGEKNQIQSISHATLLAQSIEYVKSRLSIDEGKTCTLHERLFRTLKSQDSILTMNYDLVADQTLWEKVEPKTARGTLDNPSRIGKLDSLLCMEIGYGGVPPPSLMEHEKRSGFYLKLHGSLDWLYCPREGCPNNAQAFSLLFGGFGDLKEGGPCRRCGSSLRVLLVPPTAVKPFQERAPLTLMWNLAFRELCAANRWVLFGLSLPPTDFELRWLLKRAIESRGERELELHIVNPCREHCANITSAIAGPSEKVYCYDNIELYLSGKSLDVQ
jgi:hypothetical protein